MTKKFTVGFRVCLGLGILTFVLITFIRLHDTVSSMTSSEVMDTADAGAPQLLPPTSTKISVENQPQQNESNATADATNVKNIMRAQTQKPVVVKKDKANRPEYYFPETLRFDLVPVDRQQKTSIHRHKLSIDWAKLSLTSPLAKRLWDHQHDCSLGLGNFQWRKKVFGMGSDLHVWSQALCNSMEEGVRIRTRGDERQWVWYDQEHCGSRSSSNRTLSMDASTMNCYFPSIELQCPKDESEIRNASIPEIPNPIKSKCDAIMKDYNVSDFRAAAMELLFSRLSPVVVEEAERQLNLVFQGVDAPLPTDRLVTVHMRWGDKKFETKLLSVMDYVSGVHRVLQDGTEGNDSTSSTTENDVIHIFLATEDPEAVEAFVKAAPSNWKVHVDQFLYDVLPYRAAFTAANDTIPYNVIPRLSRDLRGKPGLWSLGSLLVAMEAKYYVLTTSSNWSRLMNELRKNVVDARCESTDCTHMMDLKFGEW